MTDYKPLSEGTLGLRRCAGAVYLCVDHRMTRAKADAIASAVGRAADRIEDLEEELEQSRKYSAWRQENVNELERELASLRADRDRLDWLESGKPAGTYWFVFTKDGLPVSIVTLHDTDEHSGYSILRSALDAAREAGDGDA